MRKKIICAALALAAACDIHAQVVQPRFDAKTTEQVGLNEASIMLKEEATYESVKESQKLQEKTSVAMVAIRLSLGFLNGALKNAKAFQRDSKNMVEIGELVKKITEELKNVAVEFGKNPKAAAGSARTLQNLALEMYSNLQYCCTIVTNGGVSFNGVKKGQKDGENLLDAKTRLDMANRIIVNLRRIHNILIQAKYQLMYVTTWGDAIREAFPLESGTFSAGKGIAEDIIKKFK